jgi:hypothetical protein
MGRAGHDDRLQRRAQDGLAVSLDAIIERLGVGSDRGLAKLLGASHGATHHWRKNGHIPEWRMAQIRELARKKGIEL